MADAKQYPIGNYAGPTHIPNKGGYFPGFDFLQQAIKEGRAKMVDLYPENYVNGSYWDTRYWDKPQGSMFLIDSEGGETLPVKMLTIDGKVYPQSNDWVIQNVPNPVKVIGYDAEGASILSPESNTPSNTFKIRSRAGGNTFDTMNVGIDSSGNFQGYAPQIYQTTSGSGGGSFFGGFVGDLVNMAKETANVWVPALSFGLSTGAISLGGTGGAGTGLLSSEAGALGAASDLGSTSSIYSLAPGASSGTGLQATIGEGTNLFSTGTNVGTDTLGTGLTLPDVPNLSSMGGGQGLTIPAAGGGLLGEAGVGNAVTAVTNPITGQPLGQELNNINTGVTDVTGTPTGTSTSTEDKVVKKLIEKAIGSTMSDNTSNVAGGLLTSAGGAISGEAAKTAQQAAADALKTATTAATTGATFRPVGITTRFGSSTYTYDPTTGQLTAAGYTPTALSDTLQTGAKSVYDLGSRYVAQSPEEAAKSWLTAQQNLLKPEQDVTLANLRNQLFQSGREGLSVAQGGDLMAANPELAAYYNSLANQNALLASQAQQFGQKQAEFGTGLLGSGLKLMGGVESLAQNPFDLSTKLATSVSGAGANAGRLNLAGTEAAQRFSVPAGSYSPFGNLIAAAGSNPAFSSALGGLFTQYAPQLGNWFTGLFSPTGGLSDLGNTVLNADNATNFWSY